MKSSNVLTLSLSRRRGRTVSFLLVLFAVLFLSLIHIGPCTISPFNSSLQLTYTDNSENLGIWSDMEQMGRSVPKAYTYLFSDSFDIP